MAKKKVNIHFFGFAVDKILFKYQILLDSIKNIAFSYEAVALNHCELDQNNKCNQCKSFFKFYYPDLHNTVSGVQRLLSV